MMHAHENQPQARKSDVNANQAPVSANHAQQLEPSTKDEITNQSTKAQQAAQLKSVADRFVDKKQPIQRKNNTGLPDNLKSGVENLSGYSMDDVKVHYNSDKPAQLQAHAYAQGNQIHIAPGQEKHLPHEAWHVVQQKQGRVKPTKQLKAKVNINDDEELEKEADVMGAKAMKNSIKNENLQLKEDQSEITQLASFSRFQGFSRLFNWTYNDEENEILSLEKQAKEMLDGLADYYEKSLRPEIPVEYAELRGRLQVILDSTYSNNDYATVKKALQAINLQANSMSTKIARYDIPLEEGFDLPQEIALPKEQYGITKETTLEEFLEKIKSVAKKPSISNLVELRELTDIFVQFLSDAMMKFNPILRPAVVALKATLIDASTDIHTAYLYSSVQKDLKKAETYYILGTLKLQAADFSSAIFGKLSEDTQRKAYPKYREAGNKPYESGAIMLASAFLKDGFVPDVVVGLPTGGVHAANRVVAALAIITGKKPLMWTTRPQGVKQESKEFMNGTDDEDIFTLDEKRFLLQKLPKGKKNIAIVDDGFVSGDTIKMTKALYQKEFETYGSVDVRTGVIEAGFQQMGEDFNGKPNPADYVVVPALSVAGKTGALEEQENEDDATYFGSMGPKSTKKVGILSERTSIREITLRDILDGK